MFDRLGVAVARYWPIWLAAWGVLLVLGWTLAPAWEQVTRVGEVAFLPEDSPSRRAEQLFRQAFPLDATVSNVVLVIRREDGPLQDQDREFIKREINRGLGQIAAEGMDNPISTVRTLAEKQAGALLVSSDEKATLVLVELSSSVQDPRNNAIVGNIEKLLERLRQENEIPAGLDIAVTGSATAGRDLGDAEAASVRAIERWTIIMVVGLLLMLYRAPLIAILPLLTVYVAVEISLRILALLAGAGVFDPSRDLRVFITVLAYGAGVDYCLFLIARYREELEAGTAPGPAITQAIGRVGGAILASAATVIAGIGMFVFARFGKIHEAGLVIPLAITVALLATLTFGAALLRLTGPWAFWPQSIGQGPKALLPDLWARLGPILLRRSGVIWLAVMALMTPFAIVAVLSYHDTNFNPLSGLPENTPSRTGTRALTMHFPGGVLGSVTVLIRDQQNDFSSEAGETLIARLTTELEQRKSELELADVRSIARPLGSTTAAEKRLERYRGREQELKEILREEAQPYYISREPEFAGRVTRLELTFKSDPLSVHGINILKRVEEAVEAVRPEGLRSAHIQFVGATANLRDLSDIKRDDQHLIQILVPAVVFILLLLVFRRVVISLYLIVSVLFSYLATLGLTFLVFQWFLGPEFAGLDWKVPIFLFTILVAVGEDYNIFLLTRVQEEQTANGLLDAIPIALARTGRIISACGFVMAGTFASLLSGSMLSMKELGFALALGVLLDTLVVRPILVPTFLVLLQQFFPAPPGRYLANGHVPVARPLSREPVTATR